MFLDDSSFLLYVFITLSVSAPFYSAFQCIFISTYVIQYEMKSPSLWGSVYCSSEYIYIYIYIQC